ncbi:MAG: helix-turn-helix domain-containing protein [Candidatus Sulfotelmatobacter sp.]
MLKKAKEIPAGATTLWKVDEAASFLNISSGTLFHWVSQNRVPCLKFGKRCLRFDPQQMKQWAASFGQTENGHK